MSPNDPVTAEQHTNGAAHTNGSSSRPVLIIVMGVSGAGKSTLAEALAGSLQIPYLDADSLHPKANIDKMSAGLPLTDADRAPWLGIVRTTAEHMCTEQDIDENFTGRRGVVIACSALKQHYRDVLRGKVKPDVPEYLEPPHPHILPTYVVFIKGDRETLLERMTSRKGHFMKAQMLDSQLETLESPEGEDGVVVVALEDSTEEQVKKATEFIEKQETLL